MHFIFIQINMVIAAPTGSGKTVVHELAVLRLLLTTNIRDIKCVFIAPNKALCQQRCVEWQKSFGNHGVRYIFDCASKMVAYCISIYTFGR